MDLIQGCSNIIQLCFGNISNYNSVVSFTDWTTFMCNIYDIKTVILFNKTE